MNVGPDTKLGALPVITSDEAEYAVGLGRTPLLSVTEKTTYLPTSAACKMYVVDVAPAIGPDTEVCAQGPCSVVSELFTADEQRYH